MQAQVDGLDPARGDDQVVGRKMAAIVQSALRDLDAADLRRKWAVILRLEPKQDGNMWWISWGGLAEGVNGFGRTPEEAIDAFDKEMRKPAQSPKEQTK